MTMTPEVTLRLRPEFEVVPLDDGAVLLRSPDQGLRVRVDGVAAAELASALRRLDGVRSLGTMLRERELGDGFEALLRGLLARGVVDVDGTSPPATDIGRFFSQFHDDAAACVQRLGASRVVVLGASSASDAIVRELRTAGVGCVDVESAAPASSASTDRGIPRRARLADLLVYADVTGRSPGARLVHRWSLSAGIPWLSIRLFGREGFVGPLFVPGDGPCHECLLRREQANWVDPDLTHLYLDRVAANATSVTAYGQLPTLVALVTHWAVLECVKFLSRFTVPALLGSVLRIDPIACRVQLHRVLRAPRCPDCSPLALRPGVHGLLYADGNGNGG